MTQVERSERSRTQILDSALKLFSHKGYGATSVRDIAEEAGLSKGNVYHHFPDKEAIFRALIDRYFEAMSQPEFPFNRALAAGSFPENLEAIGQASADRPRLSRIRGPDLRRRRRVRRHHVRKFYQNMADRFDSFMKPPAGEGADRETPVGLSPVSAVMLSTRISKLLHGRDPLRRQRPLRQGNRRGRGRDLPHPPARHAAQRRLTKFSRAPHLPTSRNSCAFLVSRAGSIVKGIPCSRRSAIVASKPSQVNA